MSFRSGRRHKLFFDSPGVTYDNPLPQGPDVLYVAYVAQTEWGTFLALEWELPVHVLDLFAEFRCITNGLTYATGAPVESSMIAALTHFGLDSMTVVEKKSMKDLILRGHPYTIVQQREIVDYCSEDVEALAKLLPVMLRVIDLPFALFRGRYTKAVARMEDSGIPVDVPTLEELKRNWGTIKEQLVLDVEAEHRFGVYQKSSWSDSRFAALLQRIGILDEWPRTDSGLLTVEDDTFKTMTARYPVLEPLRDLRSTLIHLRDLKLTVGSDGRNRCSLMAFRSKTGRNYPPSSKFIFGPSTWLRSLIKPEPGRAIAYIDWISAEFGIAAALSGDARMKSAYESGDVYMSFAIDAGAAPKGATKHSHAETRNCTRLSSWQFSTDRDPLVLRKLSASHSGGLRSSLTSIVASTTGTGSGVNGFPSSQPSGGLSRRSSVGPCTSLLTRRQPPSRTTPCRRTVPRCFAGPARSPLSKGSKCTLPCRMRCWSVVPPVRSRTSSRQRERRWRRRASWCWTDSCLGLT
jgi:DNA polymerase-1